jgi:hypothetical protein
VLLHDLLLKGKIEASDKWAPKGAITRHQARLKAELVRLQIKAGKSSIKELGRSGSVVQARYVRWNPNAGTGKGKASKGGDKPCGECGTRKWRRDRATNGVVCEQGHPQLVSLGPFR